MVIMAQRRAEDGGDDIDDSRGRMVPMAQMTSEAGKLGWWRRKQ